MALPYYTGSRFGRLTVVKFAGIDSRKNRSYECLCDCGQTKHLPAAALKAGYHQSCGCLQKEKATETLRKVHLNQSIHGMAGNLTYVTWRAMLDRCFNRNHERFKYYGAKGVTACPFLVASPKNLVAVVGERPSKEMTLDRINSKGNYACGQCEHCITNKWTMNLQWSTAAAQSRNRGNNVWITMNGKRQTRADWAKELGITYKQAVKQLTPDPK